MDDLQAALRDPANYTPLRRSRDAFWPLKHESVLSALVASGHERAAARRALREAVVAAGGHVETNVRKTRPGQADQVTELWLVPAHVAGS